MQQAAPTESMSTQVQSAVAVHPMANSVRSSAVDIVKGIAILLVVLGHTGQGLIHRGWWATPHALFFESFIYSFHMPAFFFVAGLFVVGSIAKRGSKGFTVEKLKTILYPYLFMGMINPLIEPLVERFRSGAHTFAWKSFFLSLADGEAGWFLFTLFVCLMIALLTVKLPHWLRFVLAAGIGMTPAFGPPLTDRVLREFCFVAAGMWVGRKIFRLENLNAAAAIAGFVAVAAFQMAMIAFFGPTTRWTYIWLGLTGTAGLFLLGRVLAGNFVGDALAWVGRASIAIFLLSAFGQGAGRELLLRVFHTREFWLQLLVPSMFAALIPAILWHRQKEWRLRWLFQWPF
jgi:fucose 4-O-acetylase-like acetyltransferase